MHDGGRGREKRDGRSLTSSCEVTEAVWHTVGSLSGVYAYLFIWSRVWVWILLAGFQTAASKSAEVAAVIQFIIGVYGTGAFRAVFFEVRICVCVSASSI